ncbi:MAG: hypothetical protein NVS9B12_15770 [Vulcanimicrobiaceae bacterium]
MIGSARKLLAQLRVLCGDADRTGIKMTDAHHDTTERNKRRGGKAEFFGSEQRGHHHIASGFELAVRFNHDAAAQIVEQQNLMCFGEAQFPRHARVFDAGER